MIKMIPYILPSPLRLQHLALRPRASVSVICRPYTPAMLCQYCWISPQWSVKPKNSSPCFVSDSANKSVELCNLQLKRWKLNGHASTQICTCAFYFIRKELSKQLRKLQLPNFPETYNQVTLHLYFNEIISCIAMFIQDIEFCLMRKV